MTVWVKHWLRRVSCATAGCAGCKWTHRVHVGWVIEPEGTAE